jgi:hypothetical protein
MSLTEDMLRITTAMREAHDSRVAAVGAIREAAITNLAEIQSDHREMADAQRKELQQFADALRHNVSAMIHDLNVERATLNADQRQRLDAFTHDLRHDMAGFLHEQTTARRAAGASQRQSLDDVMSALRKRTASFLADVHAARMAVHADQDSARQAWQQFNTEMHERRAGQPSQSAEAGQRSEFTKEMRKRRTGKRPHKAPQA